MAEITKSINEVTTIVSDIAAASMQQSTGVDEVNKALTLMDGVTQQNSALVEENGATAKTLELQAQNMDDQVGLFRLDGSSEPNGQPATARPAPQAASQAPSQGRRAA